jgi:alkylation response protein AidB-like acyl-CoA dehydrogenase
MSATDFVAERRDLRFVLFEQLKVQDSTDPRFTDYDREVYEMVLEEAAKMAEGTIAPLNSKGDRQGCRYEDGQVRTPDGYKKAYDLFCQAGWAATGVPAEYGGQGLPMTVSMAILETFTGACCAFMMYPGLTSAAGNLLRTMGTDWMKEAILPHLVAGDWAGTMCLTEPQAGSAVGDVATVATKDGDSYLLQGTKLFVSGGEQDLTDNIIHIMLARTPDAPSGIKGLSLFMVPKVMVGADGSLGELNDIHCSGIEHKMGINGSATCTLSIGDNGGARGWIIGEEGEGILRMFHMMNEARIGVGIQGLAVASAAMKNAFSYARERIQGTDVKQFKDADAQRVAIIEHADVRRMLLYSRSVVHGMRAMAFGVAGLVAESEAGDGRSPEAKTAKDIVDVLVPIVKAWNTDQCFEVARLAVQVYGGYGYIGEYPVEQHVRDSKIFSIYEGTNGIQALDLVGRKMSMKGGRAFMATMNYVNQHIEALGGVPALAEEKAGLEKARDRLGQAAMHLMQQGMSGEQDLPVAHACDVLNLFGDVVIAVFLGQQAAIALPRLAELASAAGTSPDDTAWIAGDDEARFYAGKVDNLRFFVHQVLPRTAGLLKTITATDRTVLNAVL